MALIHTTRGEIEESALVKTDGVLDNENEYTTWVEYRPVGSDEIVRRDVHVTLKRAPSLFGGIGEFR